MAVLTHLETDTGTNVDISGATAVGAYTANGDKLIMVDVSIDAVAGNGDYVMYVTRQIGGSGSAYRNQRTIWLDNSQEWGRADSLRGRLGWRYNHA